jgi:transposase-like protein
MAIKNEIIDELLKDKDPKTIFTSEGLLGELKKALAERVLKAEMDHLLQIPRRMRFLRARSQAITAMGTARRRC